MDGEEMQGGVTSVLSVSPCIMSVWTGTYVFCRCTGRGRKVLGIKNKKCVIVFLLIIFHHKL